MIRPHHTAHQSPDVSSFPGKTRVVFTIEFLVWCSVKIARVCVRDLGLMFEEC